MTDNKKTILVVDDDVSVTASLTLLLKQYKFQVIKAHSPNEALDIIEQTTVDLILQDMNFTRSTTGEEGMALLQRIKTIQPDLPIILMTAWGSIALAVEGMRLGASDFITKPWDNDHLIRTINTIVGLSTKSSHETSSANQLLSRNALSKLGNFSPVVGESPAILKVLTTVARVCKTDASVLILGESGTGKEVIADAIHLNSKRHQKAMVKVNLGGISPSLFESEMFGHVKGAFTDAKQSREGRFSAANNSSIFLDELGELDKSSQVKLLRVLQDQNFQQVGSSTNSSVNVRVISATNQNLEEMVASDSFREDLFYRINLITITLPPLRERSSDIPLLAKNHLTKISKLYGVEQASLSPAALQWLQQQPWPGNIRQLCQNIERVLLMSGKSYLELSDFTERESAHSKNIEINDELPDNNANITFDNVTLEQMEKLMIERSLSAYQFNISKVADALGLSRASLYRRIAKHDISAE